MAPRGRPRGPRRDGQPARGRVIHAARRCKRPSLDDDKFPSRHKKPRNYNRDSISTLTSSGFVANDSAVAQIIPYSSVPLLPGAVSDEPSSSRNYGTEKLYEVERIIGACFREGYGQESVLVKWTGFKLEESTWEYLKSVEVTAPEAVEEFFHNHGVPDDVTPLLLSDEGREFEKLKQAISSRNSTSIR